jgi:hypothetical protein
LLPARGLLLGDTELLKRLDVQRIGRITRLIFLRSSSFRLLYRLEK